MTQMIQEPAALARTNGSGNGAIAPRAQRQSALASMAERFAIEPSRLMEVLKATVIKGPRNGPPPTNEEVAAFIVVANQYGLNPFTREIHAFTDGQRGIVPIVGVDGWAHIVNDQPRFDGCDFEEVKGEDGDWGVICTMHVKDRAHPVRITEWFNECKRNTPPWNTMKRRMLRHKAFMQAARYAFSISGIYDEDEARDILKNQSPGSVDLQSTPADDLTRRLTQRPVSEGQTFVADPEAVAAAEVAQQAPESQEKDVAGADAEPAADFQTWDEFCETMASVAAGRQQPEKEMHGWIAARVLKAGVKGKEKTLPLETLRQWHGEFVGGVA